MLSSDCINAIKRFQKKMSDKQNYLAFYIRVKIPMSFDAMTTSPVESMNAHLKDTMGVSHNSDTSNTCVKVSKGASKMISSFKKDAQWQLQFTSLASQLDIKDTLIRESLYICNQNFDRRMKLHCVQTSKDEWIMWLFPKRLFPMRKLTKTKNDQGLELEIPNFLNVYQVRVRTFLDLTFLHCDCCYYERCGIPCEHVFLLTNTLTHEMIKIQHWKIFATHYDSNCELGMEVKRCQLELVKYEGMGVPIGPRVIETIREHNTSCAYPYLYFGTTMENYKEAMYILDKKQCITEYEYRKIPAATTAINEMTRLTDFSTNDTVMEDTSLFDGNYDKDPIDMMCAAVDGPCEILSPIKNTHLFPQTPTPLKNGVFSSNDQTLYLTPTTRVFQQNLKNAAESNPEIYDQKRLQTIRKNLIESMDHIFQHALVSENERIGKFVTVLSRSVNNVLDLFHRAVFEECGNTFIGRDDELVYPATSRKRTKHEHRRNKGFGG
jgi:hypothetical protein